jgi:phosphoglycolate phosphatase-like HAD superfamily hydrolase
LIYQLSDYSVGTSELCNLLDSKKIRRGLITRNMKSAVDLFHQRFGVSSTFSFIFG